MDESKALDESQVEESILKEKPARRKQTLTDEQRQQKAEHMRRISLERIEKARLANESKLEEVEDKLVEKLAKVTVKKEQVRKIKEDIKPTVKPTVKPTKKIVYETDSSIEDGETTDESEDEVIYVAKKSSKAKKEVGLVKPKKTNREKEVIQEIPKQIIKFL